MSGEDLHWPMVKHDFHRIFREGIILNKKYFDARSSLFLLDIFSYSCMNCLRSLKYIRKINKKYDKYGLSTLLIHAPEWEFEKDKGNIAHALKSHSIPFPIINDKGKMIIQGLKIDFWPAQVLMYNNKIIYKHIGEGSYKKLEERIRQALKIKSGMIFNKEPEYTEFPTLYVGRIKNTGSMPLKNRLNFGYVYTKGKWLQKSEFLQSVGKENSLTILAKGNIVNFVAESANKKPVKAGVRLNNKFIRNLTISKPQLYPIIKLKGSKKNVLTLTSKQSLAVYSFSFV